MRERGKCSSSSVPAREAVPAPRDKPHDAVIAIRPRHPSAGRNVPAGAEWSLRHRELHVGVDILYANAPNSALRTGL